LFTYLLTGLFQVFGYQVNLGRLLSLLFSTSLIWGSLQYLRLVWGRLAALAGLALLVLLPGYLSYSVSVMIGLPSLAFAMLAMLALALWHTCRHSGWLWLSGLLFSLSIFTKLITTFVIPIFIVGLLAGEYPRWRTTRRLQDGLRPALLWSASFGLSSILLGVLLVGPIGIPQLVLPHFQASQLDIFRVPDSTLTIQYHLRPAWPVLLLALLGAISLLRHKHWLGLYPLAWAVTAYLVLAQYAPVWVHQQLLVSVPATLVAAGGVGEALVEVPRLLRRNTFRWRKMILTTAALVTACLVLAVQLPQVAGQWRLWETSAQKPTSAETTVLRKLEKFAPQTLWLVTDRPMYAFRAGLLVPPELAVFSSKRVETGYLTASEVQAVIQRYQPEQILIGRFEFPGFDQAIQSNYRMIYESRDYQLFVRNDLN
jgi:4-amino-4-deoxy-L-arabinose transferase-like glycosyltransferase